LNEYTNRYQRALGPQLGEHVGRHVVVTGDVVELLTLEVILELAHLSAVGVHCLLLDIACLVDLIDDDLGVVVRNKSLDSKGNGDAQPMDQGLILRAVVGRFVVDLQDVFQVIALGGDEEDACACSCAFEVQRTVEVHLPVLRLLNRRGLLGLRPLGDEIGEDLGLDGLLWENSRSNSPNSTDHLTMHPTVSRLSRISSMGKLETTLILCD
jgi:hypothetical protein